MTTQQIVSVDLVRAALRSEHLKSVPVVQLEQDVRDYARFLQLAQKHDGPLAPTARVDEMWHLHMQHPVAYFADCTRLFGEILDHDGGFGSDPNEAEVLKDVFAQTSALWEAEFREPYVGANVKCTRNCVNRCQRRCKTVARRRPFVIVGGECHQAKIDRLRDELGVALEWVAPARVSALISRVRRGTVSGVIILDGLVAHGEIAPLMNALRTHRIGHAYAGKSGLSSIRRAVAKLGGES